MGRTFVLHTQRQGVLVISEEEAIENANDGDTIYIVNNANITSTYTVNKNVTFVVAPNYETNVNGEGKHSPKPKVNGEYPSTQYVIQNQQDHILVNFTGGGYLSGIQLRKK